MAHAEQQQARQTALSPREVTTSTQEPTRLTVRGVTNNNMAHAEQQQARQTALSPREVTTTTQEPTENSIKQEPLPSPPAVPIPVPGPPVKKRRRDENNVNTPTAAVNEDVKEVNELTAGATVKVEADGGER